MKCFVIVCCVATSVFATCVQSTLKLQEKFPLDNEDYKLIMFGEEKTSDPTVMGRNLLEFLKDAAYLTGAQKAHIWAEGTHLVLEFISKKFDSVFQWKVKDESIAAFCPSKGGPLLVFDLETGQMYRGLSLPLDDNFSFKDKLPYLTVYGTPGKPESKVERDQRKASERAAGNDD